MHTEIVNLDQAAADGDTSLPASAAKVQFCVLPFFPQEPSLAALAALPELQVVQTQIAGIDRIRPWVPADEARDAVATARGRALTTRALPRSWWPGASAALDVTDPEPLGGGQPALARPTCSSTPHIAGGSTPASARVITSSRSGLR